MDFFGGFLGGRGLGGWGGPGHRMDGGSGGDTFQAMFRAYSGVFMNRPDIDESGKIILPPTALEELAHLHISYPMLFEIKNNSLKNPRKTHCGVLEFVAEPGHVYMPHWMMEHLCLQPGQLVSVKSVTLQKGSFVRLRPQTTEFIDIANPRAVLERQLRNFSALTKGDTIMINYNRKTFLIDIMDVATRSGPTDAISIVETDVEVDFAAPLDYVEPPKPEPKPAVQPVVSGGGGASSAAPVAAPKAEDKKGEEKEPEPPKFQAFGGCGKRLDGKASAPAPAPAASSTTTMQTTATTTAPTVISAGPRTLSGKPVPAEPPKAAAPSGPVPIPAKPAGEPIGRPIGVPITRPRPAASSTPSSAPLVFGRASSGDLAKMDDGTTSPPPPAGRTLGGSSSGSTAPPQQEEKKFSAFTGQGRSLK